MENILQKKTGMKSNFILMKGFLLLKFLKLSIKIELLFLKKLKEIVLKKFLNLVIDLYQKISVFISIVVVNQTVLRINLVLLKTFVLNCLNQPYVCNPCSQKKTCRRIKYYYYSNLAHKSHIQLLSDSRTGINLTENQIALIDKEISPLLLKQNQPINHIYSYKKEILPFSKPTFYSYINKNVFTFRNVDLPRKVKLKPRKSHNIPIVKKDKSYRINRTYEDYPKYITLHPNAYIVQMYTVEGIKGGKVFLTFLFVKNNLMLIFLLDNKDTDCVFYAFEFIKHSIGIKNFMKYFEVILTDNGSEFSDPVSIETDIDTGEIVSNVFYCDSGKSWQKGNIEKNHEYIRYVLPKGSSFDNLTQEDTNLLMNHINSTCRDSLNGKSPYDLATHMNFLNNLNIQLIAPSEVNLSKDLLKK